MATTVTIDQLTDLQGTERNGALRRLTREALVSGLTDTSWAAITSALDDVNMPQYGDYLTSDTANNAWSLRLVQRDITVIDKDKVRVKLIYENILDLEQDLDDPRTGSVLGEIKTNLQQKTSSFDADGNQVTVSHTYPETDPDDDYKGETFTQGVEYQYYEPQKTMVLRGIKQTRTPWTIADQIVGKVNSEEYVNADPRTWLCTSCNWKLYALADISGEGKDKFLMEFEFQYNPDTWDPKVTFKDDRTGLPPADLVENTGYKTIEKQDECDFADILGVDIWIR